ncbi:YbaB/EbfC family nucleoid-associated protein [Couchioplanes caeruleus]|nr:YbaB/EbfC family nucleoid-associated protein [Couchioplanes caeruleus]
MYCASASEIIEAVPLRSRPRNYRTATSRDAGSIRPPLESRGRACVPHQADRDANRALRARFDDVRSRYERLRSGMDEMQQRLARMAVTVESPDALVRATVGPRGQLVDLKLDREIYRRGDPDELARTILRTVEEAVARTTDQVQEMLSEYLPPDSGAAGFLRDGDFGQLLSRQDQIMREADENDGR